VAKIRVLRVFTDADLRFGNPLGVVEDASEVVPEPDRRQALAASLGFSETLFVDDAESAQVRMYSGKREVPFAGHAAVGGAWALKQITGRAPSRLATTSSEAQTWTEDGLTWVRSTLATTPPWWHERLPSPEAVECLDGPLSPCQDMTQLWAWIDEPAGVMRVRTFASRAGIPEDEACGSGAMRMAAAFGRQLVLRHGSGSIIYAKPGPPGYADIGGYVTEDAPRTVLLRETHPGASGADL
jgi:predicted PhzF superfamily epimerase YddE/YHI9